MSILSNLSGKRSAIWKPEPGVEIKILPLGFVDHYEDFVAIEEEKDVVKKISLIKKIIVATLKKSIPDASEEEIREIDLSQMISLLPLVQEVNSIDMDTDNKEFMEKIKQMQGAKP